MAQLKNTCRDISVCTPSGTNVEHPDLAHSTSEMGPLYPNYRVSCLDVEAGCSIKPWDRTKEEKWEGKRGVGMEFKNNEVAIQHGERASSEDKEKNKGYRQSKEILGRNVQQECEN